MIGTWREIKKLIKLERRINMRNAVKVDVENFNRLREKKAFSQNVLAARANLSPTTINRLNHGCPVSFSTIRRIAAVLDVEPAEIMLSEN